ncbi:hypothetical protein SAMN04487965_1721 [Microbulbifer donghaiensis]|uniref:Membrane domain of glycerophosphoryl diester phosphodiesterase n=1 Tax=Microbulbifer donghaiensis TaxID=494016 RepID=A0A1M5A2W8_9GAMM|nr:hypothetical protein [Microbulbifer donghaiensis]SHF24276.1 hypothetical protein SAMN04487965_1721 [Microbulbifer donghaiensis]
MSDIYKAPEAQLTSGEEGGGYGSLERGVAGDYSISIGEIFGEAWRRTKGNKGTVWLAIILYIVAFVVVSFVAGMITGYSAFDIEQQANASFGSTILYQILVNLIAAPLTAGMMMIGIKIARDEKTSATEVFAHFDKLLPLVVANIIMSILVTIGIFLLVLPGIYLAVAYMLTLPLIVDKNLGPWQALETSRKAITKHWFAFFGFLIVALLLYVAGALPLLIGLIWVLPLLAIAFGVVYRNVFGGPESA